MKKAGQELYGEVEAFFGRVLRVHERYVHVLGNNLMLKQKERPEIGPELPKKCASHKVGLLVCQQMHAKQPTFFFREDYNASTYTIPGVFPSGYITLQTVEATKCF